MPSNSSGDMASPFPKIHIHGSDLVKEVFSKSAITRHILTFETLRAEPVEWSEDGVARSRDPNFVVDSYKEIPIVDGASAKRLQLTIANSGAEALFMQEVTMSSIRTLPVQTSLLLMDLTMFEDFKTWIKHPRNSKTLRHYPFLAYIGVRLAPFEYGVIGVNHFRRQCSYCRNNELDFDSTVKQMPAASGELLKFVQRIEKFKSLVSPSSVSPALLDCPCFEACYCSTKCQQAHWAEHKRSVDHTKKPKADATKPPSSLKLSFYVML
jgi:hypothetical protein